MKLLCELAKLHKKRVCVALSGGRDSVALLHFLLNEGKKDAIMVSALTCEHGIRGESSKNDLSFVRSLCQQWNVPLREYVLDVPSYAAEHKIGLEEAGRILRYQIFDNYLKEGGADVVATAHHRDDFAETVLFRILRGTSLAGLDVFPERAEIVRPFKNVSRAEIDAYVRENGLPYREDESNQDTAYTRNFLRREVLPLMEGRIKGASENLVKFAERAAEDERLLATMARQAIEGKEGVPVNLPVPIFYRACLIRLKSNGIEKDYTSANLHEVAKLCSLQSGKRVTLPDGLECAREGDEVVFYCPRQANREQFPFHEGEYEFGEFTLYVSGEEQENSLMLDWDCLPKTCVVRTRREGDTFTKFSGGTKSLKSFLTDKKISARVGKSLPLVASGSEIFVVCGVEISEKVKVTADTVRRAYIRICPRHTGDNQVK